MGYIGTTGDGDCLLASRSALKDHTDPTSIILVVSLFQNGAAGTPSALYDAGYNIVVGET